jgi:hypothetical protein
LVDGDPQGHVLLGVCLALAGNYAPAIKEGEKGVRLLPIETDADMGAYLLHQLIRIYMLAGDHDSALEQLETLVAQPYVLSPGRLRIDPDFRRLRGDPRFQRLIQVD